MSFPCVAYIALYMDAELEEIS